MTTEPRFLRGLLGDDEILHDQRMHYAFFGRSNVGKSSLINAVLNKKGLARSSNKPGKTLEINVYEALGNIFLDFPGFGYAKTDQKKREKIRRMIIWYLSEFKKENRIIIMIIDSKAGMTDNDLELLDICQKENLNFIVVANKIDKIGQSDFSKLKKEMSLKIAAEKMFFVSCESKKGIEELKDFLIDQNEQKII